MQTAHQRVSQALDLLTKGLAPFIEKELKEFYGDNWIKAARASFRDDLSSPGLPQGDVVRWDAHSVLTIMWDQWNRVFRKKLGSFDRSLVNELRTFRNRWAHQVEFGFDDSYRILDSTQRLLEAVSAREATEVEREKYDLLKKCLAEEATAEIREARNKKSKWFIIGLYLFCGTAAIAQILVSWESKAVLMSIFLVIVFAYFIYQRLVRPLPVYGPRECDSCQRIIYSSTCPYCEGHTACETTPPHVFRSFSRQMPA